MAPEVKRNEAHRGVDRECEQPERTKLRQYAASAPALLRFSGRGRLDYGFRLTSDGSYGTSMT